MLRNFRFYDPYQDFGLIKILFYFFCLLGRSILGFSLSSPDLVICGGSPDIPRGSYEDSPEFLKGTSVQLSLEDGINGSEMMDTSETPADANIPTIWEKSKGEICAEGSFELPVMSINNSVSKEDIFLGEDESPKVMGMPSTTQCESPKVLFPLKTCFKC